MALEAGGRWQWHEKNYGRCESFMRIMVFMKGHAASRFPAILCALFLAIIAPSAQPTPTGGASNSNPGKNDQGPAFSFNVQSFPRIEIVSPIVGLIAAVGFTHLLQRRRNAQVEAWARIDR
jgi:hypothetical protein